jgi:hypothetical protein
MSNGGVTGRTCSSSHTESRFRRAPTCSACRTPSSHSPWAKALGRRSKSPPDLDEIEAERLDLRQLAVECRPVQEAGDRGVGAEVLRHQRRERRKHRGAEVAADPDRVPGERWLHEAVVGRWQVSPHHPDLVMAALALGAGRQ